MIKLVINCFLILFLLSCEVKDSSKLNKLSIKDNVNLNELNLQNSNKETKINNTIKYIVGDPYYIEGVEHIPEENFNYSEVGLATFYDKSLHNIKTINNDLNKVTELLGRHKTLPLPSVVKVTNLENGLSLTLKINDRLNDNSSLIQVSRKSAQLLKFYKNKIVRVRVEIISDPSKQMKIVTESMNETSFNETIDSAPTESVSIINMLDDNNENKILQNIEDPIELGFENIDKKNLFLKIYDFESYSEIKEKISELNLEIKFITEKNEDSYSLIIGPLKKYGCK